MLAFEQFAGSLVEFLDLDIEGAVSPFDGLYTELALDSFQALQLVVTVESMAGAMVPPVDMPELHTVQDAYDYYCALARSGSADEW